jgi:hypothetical protein
MRWFFSVSLFLFTACGLPANDDDRIDDDSECALSATSWEVDPEGEDGQIHPRSLRVGDTLWTAYNRPDGDTNFGVFVAVRSCDGTLLSGPKRLDDGLGNATDPDLVASGDRVVVAWQTDDQGTPWNLSVRTALLDLDGDIVREDERLVMTEEGGEWQGNAWMAPRATFSQCHAPTRRQYNLESPYRGSTATAFPSGTRCTLGAQKFLLSNHRLQWMVREVSGSARSRISLEGVLPRYFVSRPELIPRTVKIGLSLM